MADIGENIKKFRIEKNMKQEELAERLFVSRQTISNYENGKSRPDVEMVLRIAEIFETDVNALVYEGGKQEIDKTESVRAIVKVTVISIASIIMYLIYRKLWGLSLHDVNFHTGIAVCNILRIGVFTMLSIMMGYYSIELICLLVRKKYCKWKYAGLAHRILGALLGIYHVMVLPYYFYEVKSVIEYYQWKAVHGDGYWSTGYSFLPVWDDIVMMLYRFQWELPVLFFGIFLILGMAFRLTKSSEVKKREQVDKLEVQ